MNLTHRRAVRISAVVGALAIVSVAAQDRSARALDIYVVDVEGGNATLFVSPSRESLLIDTGNGGQAAARDADRMLAAAKDAGLTQIDHLITTHYHGDHFGAMAAREPDSDSRVHRSRSQCRDESRLRSLPAERLSDALCQGAAHRRATRAQDGSFTVANTRNGFSKTYGNP